MDPAVDPFSPLIKLLDRYKRDVHQLQPGASEEAIRAAERHLGHRLPFSLASLVAFADLPGGRQWAYAPDGQGDWIFGEVKDGLLIPLHDRFDRWLSATIRRFDEDIRDPEAKLAARREVDPDGGWLLLHDGEALLAKGDPVEAGKRYSAATAADPSIILAWQRGGELALAEGDRERARFNLLRALRASRLPLPWPGARVIDPGALRTLGGLLPPGDPAWERELASFLDERVSDVRTSEGLRLYVAVVRERARAKVERGERRAARDLWAGALDRARSFARREVLADAVLALVHLEIELGEHDEAERRLRPLLLAEDAETRARGHLAIGRIAVTRQEPWAEEILEEAAQGLSDPADLALRALLCGERHLLNQRHPQARQMFMEADHHAIRAGDPTLQAWVCVGLGDCARGEGQLPQAAQTYKAAESRAHEARDPELISRVKLREGDMLAARGRAEDALACYAEAAASYKALELRAREGWARLRIARLLGPESPDGLVAARQARELFAQPPLSLAAGIGAADAFLGDPARSLPWHLNLAAIHAKDRLEAQRARPPMTRADADRPERRLGAHRVAISAMGLPVVKALDAELSRLSRDLMAASARPGDPKVTAYVAAADLLASHRSYEASQALLHQLFERPLPDAAARALKGAITRSANGALVDGLLSAVEKPGEPRGVAAAAEVLGWRREVSALGLQAILRVDGGEVEVPGQGARGIAQEGVGGADPRGQGERRLGEELPGLARGEKAIRGLGAEQAGDAQPRPALPGTKLQGLVRSGGLGVAGQGVFSAAPGGEHVALPQLHPGDQLRIPRLVGPGLGGLVRLRRLRELALAPGAVAEAHTHPGLQSWVSGADRVLVGLHKHLPRLGVALVEQVALTTQERPQREIGGVGEPLVGLLQDLFSPGLLSGDGDAPDGEVAPGAGLGVVGEQERAQAALGLVMLTELDLQMNQGEHGVGQALSTGE